MKLHLLVGASLAALACATPAFAMPAPDALETASAPTVYGRVTNAAGAPLAGAEIIVRQTGERAVSDSSGRFILPVPAGETTFDVVYIGYPTESRTISATGGEAVSLAIVLGASVDATLEDVVVTGVITDGIARSLNQQRNADGVVNVLSAAALGVLWHGRAADVLARQHGQEGVTITEILDYLSFSLRNDF